VKVQNKDNPTIARSSSRTMILPRQLAIACALGLTAAALRAQPAKITAPLSANAPADLNALLDQPAKPLTSEKSNLAALFYAIGKTYGVTITVDPASRARRSCGSTAGVEGTHSNPTGLPRPLPGTARRHPCGQADED